MKTLIITLEYPPQIGGIASYTYNLAKNLPATETVVYAPKIMGGNEFDLKNKWKTVREKPYFKFFWPKWLKLYFQIKKIVKTEKIEQIYVHHALPVGYVAYWLNKKMKIPYTIFFHGTDLEMATKVPGKKKKLKMVCQRAEKIIVNSIFLQDKFKSKFEDLNKDVRVIYPCPGEAFFGKVSENEIKKLKSQLALEGKSVILTVSRIAEGKGFPHMARLLPQILEKIPNLVWLIVGDGPKKDEIMKLIQKNYLHNITRFIGAVPYNELPRYYQLADLLVLLTHPDESVEEGWGTVFVESAACGVPVVAGRVGGVGEVVEDLVTGLVVDVYQEASVIAAISDLLREKEYAKKMGAAGRERALKEFTWQQQFKKLL
ncbi:MAG: glycosyltransferase family 4 protein [Patescibacteria group bacterium]